MVFAGSQVQNLSDDFAASTAANIPWQLFGNGVIVSPRRTPGEHHSALGLFGTVMLQALLGNCSEAVSSLCLHVL